jgi:hypothetical protein
LAPPPKIFMKQGLLLAGSAAHAKSRY